jgi:hypothetical protein
MKLSWPLLLCLGLVGLLLYAWPKETDVASQRLRVTEPIEGAALSPGDAAPVASLAISFPVEITSESTGVSINQFLGNPIAEQLKTMETLLDSGSTHDAGTFGFSLELSNGCKRWGKWLQGYSVNVRDRVVLDTPEGRASAAYLDQRRDALCSEITAAQAKRFYEISSQLIERTNELRSRTAQALMDDPDFDYQVAGSQTGLTEAQQLELSAQYNAASEKHDKALIGLVFDNSDLRVVSEALWKMGRMDTWRLGTVAYYLRDLGTGTLVLPHNDDRRGPRIFELSGSLIACGYHPDVCGAGRYRVISTCSMTHSCTPTLTLEGYLAARYHPNDILVAKDFVQQIMLERARRKTVTFPLLH